MKRMLRLNNELLTTAGIIAAFERDVMNKAEPTSTKAPSLLSQFKTKLKAIYFPENKLSKDDEILPLLEQDSRFNSDYFDLKNALQYIFASSRFREPNKEMIFSSIKTCQTSQNSINPRTKDSWDEFNAHQFGYFNDRPDLFPLFNELANACRVMIVLIEKNNSPEDNMAYTYAYRLMALYIDPNHPHVPDLKKMAQHAEDLIKNVATHKNTPYHDVLLNQIQLPNAGDVKSMAGWRQFITQNLKDNAISALRFFAMAPDIEKQIEKQADAETRLTGFAPKSLAEAKDMAARVHYMRGDENPELAVICREYKIPETGSECSFNTCLDYLSTVSWPIKTTDLLPHPEIMGEGIAAEYRWVKLPTDDLRALVLGVITGCCQSIGGDSEKCVKDAITLPENGLYVLLKLKSGKALKSPSFLSNQSINYNAFEIVGQSYGWISQRGSLTLDSLECSQNRVPTEVADALLAQFANQVLQENPTIKRVTLGTGGGTPKKLNFDSAIVSEKIRTGYNYGDAVDQVCLATQPQLNDLQFEAFNKLLQPYGFVFRTLMYELSEWIAEPQDFVEELQKLLQKEPDLNDRLKKVTLRKLLTLNPSPSVFDLESLSLDQLKKMPPEEQRKLSFTRLFWNCHDIDYFLYAIPFISDETKRCELIFEEELFFRSRKSAFNQASALASENPEYLITFLKMIPEAQRFQRLSEAAHGNESAFQYAVENSTALLIIFDYLPEKDRLSALTSGKNFSNSLLMTILNRQNSTDLQLLKDLLYRLSLKDFHAVLNIKDKDSNQPLLLKKSIDNPAWLSEVLNFLSRDDQRALLIQKNKVGCNVFNDVFNSNHLTPLTTMFSLFTAEECLSIFLECAEHPNFPSYQFEDKLNGPEFPYLKQILFDKINSIELDSSLSLDSIKQGIENATKISQIIENVKDFQQVLVIQKSKRYKSTFKQSHNEESRETKEQSLMRPNGASNNH